MIKIAVVQEPPNYLNLAKLLGRAIELIADAGGQGCTLICWDNHMALARYALYTQIIEI